jgi:hypothetical protein
MALNHHTHEWELFECFTLNSSENYIFGQTLCIGQATRSAALPAVHPMDYFPGFDTPEPHTGKG